MCLSSIAAVTNHHRLTHLKNNIHVLSNSSVGQTSDTGLTGLQWRCWQGSVPSRRPSRSICSLAIYGFWRLPAFLAPGFSLHLQCQQRSIFPPLPDSAPPLLSSHLLLWLTLLPPSAKDPGDDLGPLGSPELSPHLKIFHLSTLQSPFHHVKERVLDTKMWISFQRRFIIQPTTGINIVKVIRYYQFPLLCGWSNLNTALGTFMSSTPTIVSLFGSYKI